MAWNRARVEAVEDVVWVCAGGFHDVKVVERHAQGAEGLQLKKPRSGRHGARSLRIASARPRGNSLYL
jgi:hypothetical protein